MEYSGGCDIEMKRLLYCLLHWEIIMPLCLSINCHFDKQPRNKFIYNLTLRITLFKHSFIIFPEFAQHLSAELKPSFLNKIIWLWDCSLRHCYNNINRCIKGSKRPVTPFRPLQQTISQPSTIFTCPIRIIATMLITIMPRIINFTAKPAV